MSSIKTTKYYLWKILFVTMTLCLLFPVGLLGWLNFVSSRKITRAEITNSALPLTRDNIYSEIHSDLLEPIYVSTTMANDSFLKEWISNGEKDLQRITSYLDQIQRKYGYFSVFFVSAKTLKYYHFNGLHKTINNEDEYDQWYLSFLDKKQEYVLDVDTNEAGNNELTIFVNFRVEDDAGNLLGVTGVGVKMDTVSRLLKETGNKYGRRVFLVDRAGEVQAHENLHMIHKAKISNMAGISQVASIILKSFNKVTSLQYSASNGRVYLTSRFMPELDWFLVVEQDENGALLGAKQNFIRTLVFGLFIWIFLAVLFVVAALRYRERLKSIARIDELTQLGNRRSFEEDFNVACSRRIRNGEAISLILMDLDGFKAVNDILGHLCGDQLLVQVGQTIQRVIRPFDRAVRWGGDEFAVLAYCDINEAVNLAERIRLTVREEMLVLGRDLESDPRKDVAISCGVVEFSADSTLESLLNSVDKKLYQCKDLGGNCVVSDLS